ncbi:hypothetical protein HA402_012353 [Bradysia odoriphaga]|nr:hypothetical protein HA402_012353 [Bradysia odoriphaga]
MKFIVVCVTVCAIALSFCFDFTLGARPPKVVANSFLNHNHDERRLHSFSPIHSENYYIKHPLIPSGEGGRRIKVVQGEQNFSIPDFVNELDQQYNETITKIVDSWLNCSKTFDVPTGEALQLFATNVRQFVSRCVRRPQRCVVDCVLRQTGVITDAGMNVTEYMLQIKKLRFNHTSFDITEKSNETKALILDTTYQKMMSLAAEDKCFAVYGARGFKENGPPYLPEICHGLIGSYAYAANECKNIPKDPRGDNCMTSYIKVRCMNEVQTMNCAYQSPFYPISDETLVAAEKASFLNRDFDDERLKSFSPIGAENYYIKHDRIPCAEIDRDDQNFSIANFESDLNRQYNESVARIIVPWLNCSLHIQGFDVPAVDLFSNDRHRKVQSASKKRKCLLDCTLRRIGVMTDAGLNETEYMLQIRQLRFNYTTFDINEKSNETKQKILDTILQQTLRRAELDNCHSINSQRFSENPRLYRSICYDLVESYALAASNCKNVKDPKGDRCETSWMILQCMNEDHRKRSFIGPFYPVPFTNETYKVIRGAAHASR